MMTRSVIHCNTLTPHPHHYNLADILPSYTDAVRYYASYMSEYELTEVEQYDEIWFLGLDASKVAGDEALQQNGGFDNEHGSYVKVRAGWYGVVW